MTIFENPITCRADDDEKMDTVMEYLPDNTSVVGKTDDGMIVYAQF